MNFWKFSLASWFFPMTDPCIWPNGIIFHQPRFPWNKGIPLLNHHLGWGRYNLTRCMVYLPNIWLILMVNVVKYNIHGSYGFETLYTPLKMNGWKHNLHPFLKRKIIWTKHLHDFGFQILIFRGKLTQKKHRKIWKNREVSPTVFLFAGSFQARFQVSNEQHSDCPWNPGWFIGVRILISMVVFGSRKRWDRWHSPSPNWQYIPLIFLAFWGVIC